MCGHAQPLWTLLENNIQGPMVIRGFLYTWLVPRRILIPLSWWNRLKTKHFQCPSAFRPHVSQGLPLYMYIHRQFYIFSRPLLSFLPCDWFRVVIRFRRHSGTAKKTYIFRLHRPLGPIILKGLLYVFIYTPIFTYLVARCKHFHHVINSASYFDSTFMEEPPMKQTFSVSIGS